MGYTWPGKRTRKSRTGKSTHFIAGEINYFDWAMALIANCLFTRGPEGKLGMFHWELGWFTKNSDWSRKHLRLQLRTAHRSCCFRTKTWYTHLNSMSWKAIDAWNNRSHFHVASVIISNPLIFTSEWFIIPINGLMDYKIYQHLYYIYIYIKHGMIIIHQFIDHLI